MPRKAEFAWTAKLTTWSTVFILPEPPRIEPSKSSRRFQTFNLVTSRQCAISSANPERIGSLHPSNRVKMRSVRPQSLIQYTESMGRALNRSSFRCIASPRELRRDLFPNNRETWTKRMHPDEIVVIALTALSSIAFLLVIASGLAIIFGTMRIINIAHGEFLMLGA